MDPPPPDIKKIIALFRGHRKRAWGVRGRGVVDGGWMRDWGLERGSILVGKVHNCDESIARGESFMPKPKTNAIFKSQQFCSQQKGKVYNAHLRARSSKMKIFSANKKEELSLGKHFQVKC